MTSTKYQEWDERRQAVFGPLLKQDLASQPRQDADGVASLYFHEQERCLSFHWTGSPGHKVEVSHGGDHEPPFWFFDADRIRLSPEFLHFLAGTKYTTRMELTVLGFAAICQAWIKIFEDNA